MPAPSVDANTARPTTNAGHPANRSSFAGWNGSRIAKRSPGRRARQCAFILPATGKRCGSVALRGDQFCNHHAENHLPFTCERDLRERLDTLTEKMDDMATPLLLDFLRQKLLPLQKTLRRFPEVAHTLTYTLDRLDPANSPKSKTSGLIRHNQKLTPQHQAHLNKIRNLRSRSLGSII